MSIFDKLQTLMIRGATPVERDAARRAYDRILAGRTGPDRTEPMPEETDADTDTGEEIGAYYRLPPRTYGARADAVAWDRPLRDIAAMMRADIKLYRTIGRATARPGELATANPIGTAPDQVKFSVRTHVYTGGGSIDITVRNLTAEYWTGQLTEWDLPEPAEALYQMLDALHEIHDAYNWDGSDSTVDYFDRRYYGDVQVELPTGGAISYPRR